MKITFEGHAWASNSQNLNDVLAGKTSPVVSIAKWEDFTGYTYLGKCEVNVDCAPVDEVVTKHIEQLQSHLQTVRADHQRKEKFLTDQISNLQALTYEPA